MDLRNRLKGETCHLAHKGLSKAHKKLKFYYDRKIQQRRLQPGDKVLILFPIDSNKLLMKWKGPFTVSEVRNEINCVIDIGGKNRGLPH